MKGKITILFDKDRLRINVHDPLSGIRFLDIELDADQTMRALSRQAMVGCEMQTRGLEKVGMQVMRDSIEFEMPDHEHHNRDSIALELARENCPERWEPDPYLGSRNNWFYNIGKLFCRCGIRKWAKETQAAAPESTESGTVG
jgi:hypothetical protein